VDTDIALWEGNHSGRSKKALQLVSANLAKLSQHMTTSRRILNHLKTLRRLFLQERRHRGNIANVGQKNNRASMTKQPALLTVLVLLGCVALSACGVTGGTSRFILPIDLGQSPQVTSEVRVASAAKEADAAHLTAVNVFKWGKFGPDDLRNLEQSLRNTITQHLPATSRSTESRLDIHLVIRRYVVSTSNTGGAVLACVAWAAASSQGKLIYKEQFYAWDAGYLVGTIGLLKDFVHKAIVRRIATTSMAIASDPAAASPWPTTFKNTSTSIEEAASHLPRTMVSLGDPFLMAFPAPGIRAVGLLTPSGVSIVQWEVAKPSENFDWQGYLGKLYTGP